MKGAVTVYLGIPGVGKTSAIIDELRDRQQSGKDVALFLSAENHELIRRSNVRPGGLMGCRKPGYSFPIDYVLDTSNASKTLLTLGNGTLAAFDEAQFFSKEIVFAWQNAANMGIDILVGSPSIEQLKLLKKVNCELKEIKADCVHCNKRASKVIYENDIVYPKHVCDSCWQEQYDKRLEALIQKVYEDKPFPGEKKTYQPFYNIKMKKWEFVRKDSSERFNVIKKAITKIPELKQDMLNGSMKPSYLDLGCCVGFFCDAMNTIGYDCTGVDVTKNFIEWGNELALLKEQRIDYRQEDALEYISSVKKIFDVTSSFATIQWVMAQQGYNAGVECLQQLFNKTKYICIVEMGYTSEDIYKDKISANIDRKWVKEIMEEYGKFQNIQLIKSGVRGLWRDLFIGYKKHIEDPEMIMSDKLKSVIQLNDVIDYWKDKWIGPNYCSEYMAQTEIRRGTIAGYCPSDHIQGRQFTLCLNNVKILSQKIEKNFILDFDCIIQAGQEFTISIRSTPISGIEGDVRELSFVLVSLSFQS